jgi:DNA-binding NarL/FixJ family response regulator
MGTAPAYPVRQPSEGSSPCAPGSMATSEQGDRTQPHDTRIRLAMPRDPAGFGEASGGRSGSFRWTGPLNSVDLTSALEIEERPAMDEQPSAKVVLVHDQTLVRAGLRALLERADGVAVVAEAAGGDEALALARRLRPQVVVMEAGPEALRTIGRLHADERLGTRMLVLTAAASDDDVWSVLRAGAPGFLREDADLDELGQAVRTVARGETFLSRSLTRRFIAELVSRPNASATRPERLAALTAREREVMALVAAGLSNEEIAQRLVFSPATAKTHVSRAMRKLAARDRAQLVRLAYETGLVQTGAGTGDRGA